MQAWRDGQGRQGRGTRARGAGGWVLAALLFGACGHGAQGKPEPGVDAVEQVRGGRRAGAQQRLLDDMPRASDDERTPFDGDRLGVGAQRVREDVAREQHRRRRRPPAADAGPTAP
ncbi:MAG: hypothetical protein IPG96_19800 [Proteobacteria bacterium]|nr:hypothetical protein [Pseudomonadota bacterium]